VLALPSRARLVQEDEKHLILQMNKDYYLSELEKTGVTKQLLWHDYSKNTLLVSHTQTVRHCLRSSESFTETQILSAGLRELSWTHIHTIMYLKEDLQREFYIEICSMER